MSDIVEGLEAPAIWQSFATEDSEPEIRRDPFLAAAEITRLRSLVDEARGVVERCQAVLAIMVKPDMTVSSMDAWTQCVEAETRTRSLLNKMGEA